MTNFDIDSYMTASMIEIFETANLYRVSNTFPVPFSNKMLVMKAGIHKMLVRIANRGDPAQTASSEAV